jgi:CelD/BcsL family acetyltransferase involved in cellulose biosynthesis
MAPALRADILRPAELGASERALWAGFVAASPALSSPFFRWEYVEAAGEVAPHGRIAVLHRAGEIDGFLAFQRRGALIQPLGAPLTDYHAVITRPGARIDIADATRLVGAAEHRFCGLVSDTPPAGCERVPVWSTDVSGGAEAYGARLHAEAPRFVKEARRKLRGLEGEFGPAAFGWEDDPAILDWIIGCKREQYRRTRLHDVFACGWTQRLLRTLWASPAADFGGRLGVFRAGGRLIGASFGLSAGPEHYVWFPAYEAAAARWSPGQLMYLHLIKQVAEEGGRTVDFGPGDHGKRCLASPRSVVHEGRVFGSALRAGASAAADHLLAAAPPLERLRARAGRRFDVITACETDPVAWLGGAAFAARRLLPGGSVEMTAN